MKSQDVPWYSCIVMKKVTVLLSGVQDMTCGVMVGDGRIRILYVLVKEFSTKAWLCHLALQLGNCLQWKPPSIWQPPRVATCCFGVIYLVVPVCLLHVRGRVRYIRYSVLPTYYHTGPQVFPAHDTAHVETFKRLRNQTKLASRHHPFSTDPPKQKRRPQGQPTNDRVWNPTWTVC